MDHLRGEATRLDEFLTKGKSKGLLSTLTFPFPPEQRSNREGWIKLLKIAFWESRMGGFHEGGFQIVERAAFSSRGNLLLQGNSYLKSTLRLLSRHRV